MTRIMDIPTDQWTLGGDLIYKYCLESDGEFTLTYLKNNVDWHQLFHGILFECAINSISFEGKVKNYSHSHKYNINNTERWLSLIKVILGKSGIQTHATVIKNLPELMSCLTHNVIKLNLKVLTTTQSLKRKGSSTPNILHQFFLYISLALIASFTTMWRRIRTSLRSNTWNQNIWWNELGISIKTFLIKRDGKPQTSNMLRSLTSAWRLN